MYGIYQISNDDTLENIAIKTGTTVEELRKINGIMTDMLLRPDSFLIVPKYDSNYEKYLVKSGDNMYAIAKKYGVDYKSLLKINGLNENDYIYPNETIIIPNGNKVYVTEEESIRQISEKLNIPIEKLITNNSELIVEEDQIIKY